MGIKKGEAVQTLADALASSTDDCIPWPHAVSADGRGRMTMGGRTIQPHVVACVASCGPRPEGMEASHLCGNGRCINPRHLLWETHPENCRRRRYHGTQPAGETHGMARLTTAQVAAIRADVRLQREIGDAYGITQQQVSNIKRRKRWS